MACKGGLPEAPFFRFSYSYILTFAKHECTNLEYDLDMQISLSLQSILRTC